MADKVLTQHDDGTIDFEVAVPGPQGPAGDVGPAGPVGPPGQTGPSGQDGSQGLTGPAGPPGNDGAAGPQGNVGSVGPQGVPGVAGPVGPKGDTGGTGPVGPQGPQGAPGQTGAPGPAGAQGNPGVAGPQGAQGVPGPQGPPGPGGGSVTVNEPGYLYFDQYFTGADDTAKIVQLNAWHASRGASGSRPAILFDARVYNFGAQLEQRSGAQYISAKRGPAREYSTGTVFNWTGAGPFMKFIHNAQGYPSDGSARDFYFDAIQFSGSTSKDFYPKLLVNGTDYSGQTSWYGDFNDCGWLNWNTVLWGYGDGLTMSGHTHFQGIQGTALNVGGSENSFFAGAQSYGTVPGGSDTGVPFIRTTMSKSYIGRIMTTNPGNSYGLQVDGGYLMQIDGFQVDAQDSNPMFGAGVVVNGGEAIDFVGLEVKGTMTNASAAPAGRNRGAVQINGGSQIAFSGLKVQHGAGSTPVGVPDVWVGPNVGSNAVKVVYALTARGGTGPILAQSKSGQIVSFDPSVTPILNP